MKNLHKAVVLAIILMLAFVGCGQPTQVADVENTQPLPATDTAIPPPTAVTATASPSLTATSVASPPTSTAIPTATEPPPALTPANSPPSIVDLEDQTIPDGERFPHIKLEEHVADADHPADEIDWHISGNADLGVRLIGSNLLVSAPGANWTGSETLHFEACDPEGLCDATDVTFAVVEENDPPLFSLKSQFPLSEEGTVEINLDLHVRDVDNADDELAWSYSDNAALDVQLVDRVAVVTAPDADWRGAESIRFQACDPGGQCSSQEVLFWVARETDLVITYVGNAGYMFTLDDQKVLVDATFRGGPQVYTVPSSVVELVENAQPPFDGVDLILTTHHHGDHYVAEIAHSHLENNPQAVFVSTRRATGQLPSLAQVEDRVVSIELDDGEHTQLSANGIEIEALELTHGEGADALNLGYIITLGEYKILHTGDWFPSTRNLSYLQTYDLPGKQIDVALIPMWLLADERFHPMIREQIQAKYIVPAHWAHTIDNLDTSAFSLIGEYFGNSLFFYDELESQILPTSTHQSGMRLR